MVPVTRVPALLEAVRGISAAEGVVMPTYGHAGDGNLHVNLLWDDPAAYPAVQRAIDCGEGWDLELPFVTAAGRSIWVRTIGEAEYGPGGREAGAASSSGISRLYTGQSLRPSMVPR